MTTIAKQIPILLVLLALALGGMIASAQTFVQYTAKFACGVAASGNSMVQPGTYSTTINIHNPHDDMFSQQPSTTFLKKAVQSLPEGQQQRPPSGFAKDNLVNDYAEEVDCTIIRTLLGITGTSFIEGYVVIISPPTPNPAGGYFTNELDVIGIYTNAKGALKIQPANAHFVLPGTTQRRPSLEQGKRESECELLPHLRKQEGDCLVQLAH